MEQTLSFENFVVGPGSRFAYLAAVSAAEHAGQVYNPLFLYGPSGVGKTHLLRAIAHRLAQAAPQARVVYRRGEDLIQEFLDCARKDDSPEAMRRRYQQADVLLLDDLWLLGGKEHTQAVLYDLISGLMAQGKQVVLASDLEPDRLTALTGRIRERCPCGLFADLRTPDRETRESIARLKARELGVELDEQGCRAIAENAGHVNRIEGLLRQMVVERELVPEPTPMPRQEQIRAMLRPLPPDPEEETARRILGQVCACYGIREQDLLGSRRKKELGEARRTAAYLLRAHTNWSIPQIGCLLLRDHHVVLHWVVQAGKALNKENPDLKARLRDIESRLAAGAQGMEGG